MWVSGLLRADGRTLKHRFGDDLQRRIDNCEDDALRLCSIVFSSGLKSPSVRPRVGRMLRAAWDGVREGDGIWHGGVLRAVHELGSTTVVIVTYDSTDGNVANRDTQHCFVADGQDLAPGSAYLAPGGMQMMLSGKNRLRILAGDARLNYKPSVDLTFGSAVKYYGNRTLLAHQSTIMRQCDLSVFYWCKRL